MSLVILARGKGEASFYRTSILLGKANKPSFTDVCMWTSAEMQLESLCRDRVPSKDQASLFFGLPIRFSATFHTSRSQASCRLMCPLKRSSNCPPLQERTQILKPQLKAPANHSSHLTWEGSNAATLLAELQYPWWYLTGQVGQVPWTLSAYYSVLLLWIKSLPRQALLLKSPASCASRLAGTALPSLTGS